MGRFLISVLGYEVIMFNQIYVQKIKPVTSLFQRELKSWIVAIKCKTEINNVLLIANAMST